MTIGEVIQKYRISESTLLRWAKVGIIPEPSRRPSGWREYNEKHLRAIEAYLRGKQTTNSTAPQV